MNIPLLLAHHDNKRMNSALKRIRELHKATDDGRSCVECSRIISLGTPNGLGGIQYPCPTLLMIKGTNV
jgi:hypothetical protein